MRGKVLGRGKIGEAVDHICLTPVGAAGRDVQWLYQRARRLQQGPLSFLAAYRLAEKVRTGDVVLFATRARDGVTRSSTLTVDGTSLAVQEAVLTLPSGVR